MSTPAWVYWGTLGLLYRIQVRVMGAAPLAMRSPADAKTHREALLHMELLVLRLPLRVLAEDPSGSSIWISLMWLDGMRFGLS